MRIITAALLLLLSAAASAQPPAQGFPAEQEAYVSSAFSEWQVPGAAIAIVKDGKVILAKGYGVRELGKPGAVDEHTIFDTASLTKAFTAAAIASLVDERKVTWDEPVRTHLPALVFHDPYLTANVTLRDLLSHRVGVRNNGAWYFGNPTPTQLIGIFRHLEPQAPFRTRWVYSNIGYQAAAEVASAASGTSLERLVTDRLIKPLDMTCTIANFDAVPSSGNYASPHAEIAGTQRPIERETARMSTAAAGAVQMCAKDLATWMLFQLGDGTHAGQRVLSADVMAEMHSPQVIVPTTAEFRTRRQIRHSATYGFGWNVWDYRGENLLWHSGGGDGQSAYLALLPEKQLGVAVVVNTSKPGGSGFNSQLANRILDHYLGSPARDYVGEYGEAMERVRRRDADDLRALEQARLRNTRPALALAGYAGTYHDKLGLDIKVSHNAKGLELQYGNGEKGTLEHWHGDTFRVRWKREYAAEHLMVWVTFRVDEHGKAAALHMEPFNESVEAQRTEQHE